MEGTNLDSVRAIIWERDHEQIAIEMYERQAGLSVTKTGLWLHKNGCLGAPPGGLIGTDAIIEVKCPHSLKDKDLSSTDLVLPKNFYLGKNQDGIFLKEKSKEMDQVQGQLYFTNKLSLPFYFLDNISTMNVFAQNFLKNNNKKIRAMYALSQQTTRLRKYQQQSI